MSIVKILSENDWAQWDNFVASHTLGTIYHTSAWRRVIEKTYGHQPMYMTIQDDSGSIKAGLPLFYIKNKLAGNRLVCLPGAQACDPLVPHQHAYNQLVAYATDVMQHHHAKSLELKTSAHFPLDSHTFGRKIQEYSCYILDLNPDLQEIESSLHKDSIRRRIKKASMNGLQLSIGNSLIDVKRFYVLYLQLRKSYGLLPQPLTFFSYMWNILSRDGYIDILHAIYQGQIISTLLLLKYKETVIYEFGASRFDMMRLSPSPFLLWEAIKQAKRDGYKRFDFGRTSDDNQSLAHFKMKWGTKREALPYYFIPDLGSTAAIRQKNLPKTMMSCVMHYAPAIVCQMMGRALYKHLV
jgi:serine/alanine adding enzyme